MTSSEVSCLTKLNVFFFSFIVSQFLVSTMVFLSLQSLIIFLNSYFVSKLLACLCQDSCTQNNPLPHNNSIQLRYPHCTHHMGFFETLLRKTKGQDKHDFLNGLKRMAKSKKNCFSRHRVLRPTSLDMSPKGELLS